MKGIYRSFIILMAAQIILAAICGPYSCDWGNTVYFFSGVFCMLLSFILPFFQKQWSPGKRTGYAFLFLCISVILWCVAFMFGGFSILCRLF